MKSSKLLKAMMLIGVLACGWFAEAAVQTNHVTFVEKYGDLYAHRGKDGFFYVREAGLGQNADPQVRRGWAAYVWDPKVLQWKIINSNDIMGLSAYDFTKYLTLDIYTADITPWKQDTRTVQGQVEILDQTTLKSDTNKLTNDVNFVDAVRTVVSGGIYPIDWPREEFRKMQREVAAYKVAFSNISEIAISEETNIGELKRALLDIKVAASNVYYSVNN